MVVVICSAPVFSSRSLIPESRSSRSTWVRINPSGPRAALASGSSVMGTMSGNAVASRSPGASTPISTMPSRT
ncbi:Uncharacterised protein [Mycobacteroides abscessus subsp. abscessus]|nr:Uncharacterised protein [Mycobacteroides abscessus subsp. abscessus]